MTIKELNQAFQNLADSNAEQVDETIAQESVQQPDSYLTYDNIDRDFGNWYKHDKDIGAILMEQLRMNGVDTRDATEAALRQVLTDITMRLDVLNDIFSEFKSMVDNLKEETEKVTDAVTDTLHSAGATVNTPAEASGELPSLPPEGAPGELPPLPEMSAPATGMAGAATTDMGGMPPEGATNELSPLPPEGASELPQLPPEGTPSDARLKNIRAKITARKQSQKPAVVSDAKMKKIEGTAINPAFVSICNWR